MSSLKTLPIYMLIFMFVIGCASPTTLATPLPSMETSVPLTVSESTPTPESSRVCYFATVLDPKNFPCSVDQLEAVIGADIYEPSMDFSQLAFVNAYWNGPTANVAEYDTAGLFYQCSNNECALQIMQTSVSIDKTNIIDWGKTPKDAIEAVELKEGAGEYVMGWFVQKELNQPEVWSSDLETQRLSWVKGDMLFTIVLDGNSLKEPMGKEYLIDLANSLE